MVLQSIDKQRYRHRLNRIMLVLICLFIGLSVLISSCLIAGFNRPAGENMDLNMLGVALAFVICYFGLQRVKHHPYLTEFNYVLILKHELNLIQRKHRQIKQAAHANHLNAMTILLFSYHGSKQLWLLDDNVLHLEQLEFDLASLEAQLAQLNLNLTPDQYRRDMLAEFS